MEIIDLTCPLSLPLYTMSSSHKICPMMGNLVDKILDWLIHVPCCLMFEPGICFSHSQNQRFAVGLNSQIQGAAGAGE